MNIGFDAKRAFLNTSGLGNYSRTLIKSLVKYFPENHYSLFTIKKNNSDFNKFISNQNNISLIHPLNIIDTKLHSRWRSCKITKLLSENKIEIYHGLSNELPFNIQKFRSRKIVTIHDLIFLKYPNYYSLIDRMTYNKKVKLSCKHADVIVAVSQQTKNDIVESYSVNPEKIKVIYQSCDEVFYREQNKEEIRKVKLSYNLPENYLLYVGTIEERKNLLTIIKAMDIVKDIPLVVIGKKKKYFKKIQQFITKKHLEKRILFLENIHSNNLPHIYSGASVFIYLSLIEGFGIPIIEALTCKTPVITTKGGCFAEAGGNDSVYIDPMNEEHLACEIQKILASADKRKIMTEKGFEHSKKFLPQVIASNMMKMYCDYTDLQKITPII